MVSARFLRWADMCVPVLHLRSSFRFPGQSTHGYITLALLPLAVTVGVAIVCGLLHITLTSPRCCGESHRSRYCKCLCSKRSALHMRPPTAAATISVSGIRRAPRDQAVACVLVLSSLCRCLCLNTDGSKNHGTGPLAGITCRNVGSDMCPSHVLVSSSSRSFHVEV